MQNLRSKSRVGCGLLLLVLVSAPLLVRADEGPSPSALQKRVEAPVPDKDGFVQENRPMMGPTVDESIPAGPLLATAYGFVWLAVLGYVVMIGRGLQRVDTALQELDQKLGKLATKS